MNQSNEEIRNAKIKRSKNLEMISFFVWIAAVLIVDLAEIPDNRVKTVLFLVVAIGMLAYMVLRFKRFKLESKKDY